MQRQDVVETCRWTRWPGEDRRTLDKRVERAPNRCGLNTRNLGHCSRIRRHHDDAAGDVFEPSHSGAHGRCAAV